MYADMSAVKKLDFAKEDGLDNYITAVLVALQL